MRGCVNAGAGSMLATPTIWTGRAERGNGFGAGRRNAGAAPDRQKRLKSQPRVADPDGSFCKRGTHAAPSPVRRGNRRECCPDNGHQRRRTRVGLERRQILLGQGTGAIVANFKAQSPGRMRILVVSHNFCVTWGDKSLRRCGPFDGCCVGVRHARFQQAGIGNS
jgi:hypothetical protein